MKIKLIDLKGSLYSYSLKNTSLKFEGDFPQKKFNRIVYAAAHVVKNPLANDSPWEHSTIDWETTLQFRHYLWDLGLGVAEAMDTAQRGMGLHYEQAKELISKSLSEAKSRKHALIACGAATDQLDPNRQYSLDAITSAYREQCDFIEKRGGRVIIMASPLLAKTATLFDDYKKVYKAILDPLEQPAILHWLGDVFDARLKGYWATEDLDMAEKNVLEIIEENVKQIDGIKISLLDAKREKSFRKRLPHSVRLYTGDDFNYPELIGGDDQHYSDALLGIFDPIAIAASAAFDALSQGDEKRYFEILNPTVALSKHIFKSPTQYYKAGVVFMAYLNGFQSHCQLLGGLESARSFAHYCQLFRLADQAKVLVKPELALERMNKLLSTCFEESLII